MRRKLSLCILVFVLLCCLPFMAGAEGLSFGQQEDILRPDLYELQALGREGDIGFLACRGNIILTAGVDDWESESILLSVFDAQTNALVAQKRFAADMSFGFLDDGRIYALQSETMELNLYDQALNQVAHLPGAEADAYANPFVEAGGERLWCLSYEEGALISRSIADGSMQRYAMAGLRFSNIDVYHETHEGLFFFAGDSLGNYGLYALDPAQGKILACEAPEMMTPMPGGLLYAVEGSSAYFSQMNRPFELLAVQGWPMNSYPRVELGGLLMEGSGDTLHLIDLSRRVQVNELPLSLFGEGRYYQLAALSQDGYALTSWYDTATERSYVYRWDYAAARMDAPLDAFDTDIARVAAQNWQLMQGIQEDFGISVHGGEEGVLFGGGQYKGEIERNELRIHEGLSILRTVLEKYPKGMLEEMLVAPIQRMDVFFCGYISSAADGGIMTAAALAGIDHDSRYIVCNLGSLGDMARNLAHEMMHVMEDRIEALCDQTQGNMLNHWMSYVPQDGGYAFSYLDEHGSELSDTRHTGDDLLAAELPDSVWFVDAYAKANPKEDRARIMEYLFDSKESLPSAFDSVHLMEKAQYLCAIIRECFPSAQTAEDLPWERLIETLPYSHFEERVNRSDLIPVG